MAIAPDPPAGPDSGFHRLLDRLNSDPDQAGASYERLRRALIRFFDWRGAFSPEDCADETLGRLAAKLEAGTAIHQVDALALGIARHVFLEEHRFRSRLSGPESLPEASSGEGDSPLLSHLQACLGKLGHDEQDLVLSYYAGSRGRDKIQGRRRLASGRGLSDNALRSRVQRLRDRIEDCVRRRLERSA